MEKRDSLLALLLVEITIYWLRRKKMVTKLKSEEYGGRTIELAYLTGHLGIK